MYTGLMSMPPLTPVKNTLKKLKLDYNDISRVPQGYFLGFKKLQKLSMCCNILRQVPDITPLHNTIGYLSLGGNKIMSLSGALNGTTYRQLHYISLGANFIKIFDSGMMSFWPVVNTLSLTKNHIVHLPISYPEINCSVGRSSSLNFAGNPIHCDKAVEGIISRRLEGHLSVRWDCYISILGLQDLVCASPAYLCGRNLGELSTWKLNRDVSIYIHADIYINTDYLNIQYENS